MILKPGDLLYFPRGWIHQGVCTDDSHHSFHVTLSTALHQNWCVGGARCAGRRAASLVSAGVLNAIVVAAQE